MCVFTFIWLCVIAHDSTRTLLSDWLVILYWDHVTQWLVYITSTCSARASISIVTTEGWIFLHAVVYVYLFVYNYIIYNYGNVRWMTSCHLLLQCMLCTIENCPDIIYAKLYICATHDKIKLWLFYSLNGNSMFGESMRNLRKLLVLWNQSCIMLKRNTRSWWFVPPGWILIISSRGAALLCVFIFYWSQLL